MEDRAMEFLVLPESRVPSVVWERQGVGGVGGTVT